jgi:hypothetical protein
MSRSCHCLATLLCIIAVVANAAVSAHGKEYVDLELVLAVDVSLSMDQDEQRLQRDGYVNAFRDDGIIKAIRSGPNGRIAVSYVEWAGAGIQSVVIPWQLIASAGDARQFADQLAGKPISRALMTSISEVVKMSGDLFATSPVIGLRRVIDVSGDGPNNSGGRVETARDLVLAKGIVINGLAISIHRGIGAYSYFDLPDLDRYYKDCVIGGPGSFVLAIRKKSEFATAIRQKLLLEIAGRPADISPGAPGVPGLRRVQFKPPAGKYDCLIGEKMWQQFRDGSGDQW